MTFQPGQKVRIVADSFKNDPHELQLGSVYEIEFITPPVKYEEFPPITRMMMKLEGMEEFDLPARVHVQYGVYETDYANIVFEDVELVSDDTSLTFDPSEYVDVTDTNELQKFVMEFMESQQSPTAVKVPSKVRILEDDFWDGFSHGDEFEVFQTDDGDLMFEDLDGDSRHVEDFTHEIIS